jgi:uncharacterized membrane protein
MLKYLLRIKPGQFFFVASLVANILYTCYRPPFQSPDEYYHFCRAYQISEGGFLPVQKDNRVGGELPTCLQNYYSEFRSITMPSPYRTAMGSYLGSSGIKCSETERQYVDFPNTSIYSPIAYLPYSIALIVLRQFTGSIDILYYGSKLFAFLVYVFCMYFAIKVIPVYKWLIVAVLMLPTNLYIMNSYTGDMMTNQLAFVLIALIFKYTFSENSISYKQLFFILLIGLLLAFCKVIYTGLLILLFMIPEGKFPSRLHKFAGIVIIMCVCFFCSNYWSSTAMGYYPTYESYNKDYRDVVTVHRTADAHKQLEHLKNNKLHIFKVIYHSLTGEPDFYMRSYVAQFGTYMDTRVPNWFVITAFIILIIIAFFEKNAVTFSFSNKVVMVTTVIFTYSLMVLAQHLVWNSVGSETFPGYQGRYLATLFPLVFMLFSNPWKKIKFNPVLLIIVSVIIGNGYSLAALRKRYLVESYTSKTAITCNAEEIDNKGGMITSDKAIVLSGGDKRTSAVSRSGKYSVRLDPDSSKSFIYSFRDLRAGDFVEITAWEKGEGGDIVVKGQGKNCEPYRFIHKEIFSTDGKGWSKLQMNFSMWFPCDSSKVSFYVENVSSAPVYFDDITYCIKRFDR